LKTYLPKLLKIATTLCKYIRRWETQIRERLGESDEAKLDAVLVACDALEVALKLLIPGQT